MAMAASASSPHSDQYFCHQCESSVLLSDPEVLICPECNSDFIEARPLATSISTSSSYVNEDMDYMGPGFGQLLEDMSNFLSHIQMGTSSMVNIPPPPHPNSSSAMFFPQPDEEEEQQRVTQEEQEHGNEHEREEHEQEVAEIGSDVPPDVNPILLVQSRIRNLMNLRRILRRGGIMGGFMGADMGAHFSISSGANPLRLPGTIGDYYIGPGLDHLIQQLSENDPNKYGSPPASKSSIEALPTIRITRHDLGADGIGDDDASSKCAVCKEVFELCAEVKRMPCNHLYHPDCIFPWLQEHNTCPVCRYELPTDDPDYEESRGRPRPETRTESSGDSSSTPAEEEIERAPRDENSLLYDVEEETGVVREIPSAIPRLRVARHIGLQSLGEQRIVTRVGGNDSTVDGHPFRDINAVTNDINNTSSNDLQD